MRRALFREDLAIRKEMNEGSGLELTDERKYVVEFSTSSPPRLTMGAPHGHIEYQSIDSRSAWQ